MLPEQVPSRGTPVPLWHAPTSVPHACSTLVRRAVEVVVDVVARLRLDPVPPVRAPRAARAGWEPAMRTDVGTARVRRVPRAAVVDGASQSRRACPRTPRSRAAYRRARPTSRRCTSGAEAADADVRSALARDVRPSRRRSRCRRRRSLDAGRWRGQVPQAPSGTSPSCLTSPGVAPHESASSRSCNRSRRLPCQVVVDRPSRISTVGPMLPDGAAAGRAHLCAA
jgi:hypothetical protein